jgi:hypothetical protein
MCFILSGNISPRPVKDLVGSVLEKFQKHCGFILATIYADTRILTGVYGLDCRLDLKRVYMTGDMHDDTTPYARKHVFYIVWKYFTSTCQGFGWVCLGKIPKALWFYFGNNLC